MGELGHGREAMADFCTIFNMPPPVTSGNWSLHNHAIRKNAEDILQKECVDAGNRLRQMISKEDNNAAEDDVLDIPVSYDGTWQHRGFSSAHGVGVVMSIDTGEVLDSLVLSKSCVSCNRMKNKDPDSDDYMIWEYDHFEGGNCEKNYEGPSSGMEQEAARVMWERSIELHKFRYVQMLCDGDSKSLNDLNNEYKPYGDVKIEKLDCVNHIQKRMGKGLRALRSKSKVIKGGSGGLTDIMIKKLGDYYRAAIMANTTDSREREAMDTAEANMKKEIMGSLYHNIQHPTNQQAEQHQYCNVRWCKWLQDAQDGTTKYKNVKRLPFSYLAKMKPLYDVHFTVFYQTGPLKSELMKRTSASEQKRLHKLLTAEELGDRNRRRERNRSRTPPRQWTENVTDSAEKRFTRPQQSDRNSHG